MRLPPFRLLRAAAAVNEAFPGIAALPADGFPRRETARAARASNGSEKSLHQAGWRERLLPPGEKLIIKEV
jgi:hypothetical protein